MQSPRGPGLPWVAFLVAGDVVFLNGAYLMAFVLRFGLDVPAFNLVSYLIAAPWITVAMLLLNSVYGLYDLGSRTWSELRPSVVSSSLITFLLGVTISFFLRGFSFPRTVLVLAVLVHLVTFYVWRRTARRLVPGRPALALALVASGAEADVLVRRLQEARHDYRLVATLPPDAEAQSADVVARAAAAGAEALVLPPSLLGEDRALLVREALKAGLRLLFVPNVDDVWLASAELRQAGDLMLLEVGARNRESDGLKRLLDLTVAALGLLLASPFMLLTALAVRLDSPGPVLYGQERVGQGGRPFRLYKFRTMNQDAEQASGPVMSSGAGDPRVTRVGRFLRASRLDELPQLWNVLRGDMSLVGPRPERPFFVEQFSRDNPSYPLRHQVKVGLTGLAQVAGRYSTTAEDKLRYDLYYVNARSFWVDLTILLRTLQTVMTRGKSV